MVVSAVKALKRCVRNARRHYDAYSNERVKKLRIGFIGCGNHAINNIYPCLRFCNISLEAVCSLHESTAKRTAAWFGAKRWYVDYKEMISKEMLDAVFIVVSREKHKEIAEYVLGKGLHVFVEKSPALSESDINDLVNLSKSVKKLCVVGYQKRYAPAYERAREIMQSKNFGRLHTIFFRFAGGGQSEEQEFLYEVGIHCIDLLRWFTGDIRKIMVVKNYQHGYSCTMHILFENGCNGVLFLTNTQSWNHPAERLEVYGDNERVVVDNVYYLEHYKKTSCLPGKIPATNELTGVWSPNVTVPNVFNQSLFLSGYGYEVHSFIEGVAGNRGKLRTSIEESIQNLRVIERVLSADTETWISVE